VSERESVCVKTCTNAYRFEGEEREHLAVDIDLQHNTLPVCYSSCPIHRVHCAKTTCISTHRNTLGTHKYT
jgi:hypothetical protein